MDRLRSPGGCPWDAAQTHESLVPYAIEEAFEVADAVARGEDLADELGDLLLQVLFHARVAQERPESEGGFTIDDVADALVAKLTRRHPHVFGDVAVSGAAEVHRNWEAIKRAERNARAPGGSGVGGGEDDGEPSRAAELAGAFERVPAGLPAVSRLSKITGKIAGAGLDVESLMDAAADQVELMDGALGRAVVAAVRAGAEPEMALRRYTLALQAAALDAARNGTAENAGGGAEA